MMLVGRRVGLLSGASAPQPPSASFSCHESNQSHLELAKNSLSRLVILGRKGLAYAFP